MQTLTLGYLADEGIELEEREDGLYLVSKFEVDECGPFDTQADALAFAPSHWPCLQD